MTWQWTTTTKQPTFDGMLIAMRRFADVVGKIPSGIDSSVGGRPAMMFGLADHPGTYMIENVQGCEWRVTPL